jgi:hypothetical protein
VPTDVPTSTNTPVPPFAEPPVSTSLPGLNP